MSLVSNKPLWQKADVSVLASRVMTALQPLVICRRSLRQLTPPPQAMQGFFDQTKVIENRGGLVLGVMGADAGGKRRPYKPGLALDAVSIVIAKPTPTYRENK